MESILEVQYLNVLSFVSPCGTHEHMGRMKVSRHASHMSDMNKMK